jgi:hypothetical protein
MELALAWALRLEGKTDQEKFKALGMGENTNPGACLAFLNADWYDFESTPAAQEDPGRSITLFDYHRLLTQTGWKVIRRIECPLSTERLTGNQVQKMQTKRILGTIGRTLLIARRT